MWHMCGVYVCVHVYGMSDVCVCVVCVSVYVVCYVCVHVHGIVSVCVHVCVSVGQLGLTEPKALNMPGSCSTTELHPQLPCLKFLACNFMSIFSFTTLQEQPCQLHRGGTLRQSCCRPCLRSLLSQLCWTPGLILWGTTWLTKFCLT